MGPPLDHVATAWPPKQDRLCDFNRHPLPDGGFFLCVHYFFGLGFIPKVFPERVDRFPDLQFVPLSRVDEGLVLFCHWARHEDRAFLRINGCRRGENDPMPDVSSGPDTAMLRETERSSVDNTTTPLAS